MNKNQTLNILGVCIFLFVLICASVFAAQEYKEKDKVYVCHKGKTLHISRNALDSHLKHGDYVGACIQPIPCSDDDCFMKKAENTNNSKYCDSVSGDLNKDLCYRWVAITRGEYDLCHNIEKHSLKEECFQYIAINTRDHIPCGELSTEEYRLNCHFYVETFVDGGFLR